MRDDHIEEPEAKRQYGRKIRTTLERLEAHAEDDPNLRMLLLQWTDKEPGMITLALVKVWQYLLLIFSVGS
jgi:hypothetical protein